MAASPHTCGLSGVFGHAHVAAENRLDFDFRGCGRGDFLRNVNSHRKFTNTT